MFKLLIYILTNSGDLIMVKTIRQSPGYLLFSFICSKIRLQLDLSMYGLHPNLALLRRLRLQFKIKHIFGHYCTNENVFHTRRLLSKIVLKEMHSFICLPLTFPFHCSSVKYLFSKSSFTLWPGKNGMWRNE